jgi:hypothetical protein
LTRHTCIAIYNTDSDSGQQAFTAAKSCDTRSSSVAAAAAASTLQLAVHALFNRTSPLLCSNMQRVSLLLHP